MHPLLVNRVIFPLIERIKRMPTYARLREIERTQWLAPEALRAYQLDRLRRHLEFAAREVPYYTQLFARHGITHEKIQSLEDFAQVPFLTKDIIRHRFEDLQPRTRVGPVTRMSTGGSTGVPVTILADVQRLAFADAARLRTHRWFNADMGVREIVLWGSSIELGRQDRIRSFRDWLLNSQLLSAFDLGESALARYAEVFRQYRPQKLFGYSSALYLLARHLQRNGWKPETGWPRAVFATAEPLYDFQRATIESALGCPVSLEYGSRDAGLVATECPSGSLHVAAEGMLVEVLDDGELVVTNLDSFAMPIIRYRTGDMGALDEAPCPCGRGLPRLRSVEGRRTDFLITPRGKVMHALAAIYVLRECPGIGEFQVVQERLDRLTVTVVPDGSFASADQERVARQLSRLFEDEISVEIVLTDAIARPPSGKHRYVISKVADAHLGTPA